MAPLLSLLAVVLLVVAAVLGWDVGPHHSPSLAELGLACLAAIPLTAVAWPRPAP